MRESLQWSSRGDHPPLLSRFHADKDMAELIEFFLDDLDHRIIAMSRAWEREDLEQLRKILHQLKGAAGGYGYPEITDAASGAEGLLHSGEAELSALAEQVEQVLLLCLRATAIRANRGDKPDASTGDQDAPLDT